MIIPDCYFKCLYFRWSTLSVLLWWTIFYRMVVCRHG